MAALGVRKGDQRRIMTQATQESVEGSWQVLKTWTWRAESGLVFNAWDRESVGDKARDPKDSRGLGLRPAVGGSRIGETATVAAMAVAANGGEYSAS